MTNDKPVTHEALHKIDKVVELTERKAELYAEMRMALIQRAIKNKDVELEIERYRRMPVGARLLWPVTTNAVGETVQHHVLLSIDEFARVAPKRELPNTSMQWQSARARWNQCFGDE